ncbi:cdc42 effector protein 3 [Electrophorus electricus]|uniref:cdc42 effector protein 3 n=1 Tax=Electrophorus electricus TaxID=8005 RepID=UPI0015D06609|nr:cdc42 effector protein 3 [Electrophorus electricus]
MPAKTPIYLKPSTPKRGKKFKLRDMLSGDMISSPLGDLQHNAHVGPEGEGDMFGDVDFLQGKLDMLPSLARPLHSGSDAMGRRLDNVYEADSKGLHHSSHGNSSHASFLKSTISMPSFLSPEQAPPKPPRLHLAENTSPGLHQQKQHSLAVSKEGVSGCREPCQDLSLSASIPVLRHLAPSTGSFSEPSSDDSTSDCGGPPEPGRGLSLDFDAGLSNEDLRSEFSESPALSPTLSPTLSTASYPTLSCSGSLTTLDLDLGPSILEDVLEIMDRYKSTEEQGEL